MRAVLTPTALPAFHTRCIERSTHDVISHPREPGSLAVPDAHVGVFLPAVALPRGVSRNFHAVAQTNTRYFAKGRVRFLRSNSPNLKAHATLLRAALFKFDLLVGKCVKCVAQRGRLRLTSLTFARVAHELVNRGQYLLQKKGQKCSCPTDLVQATKGKYTNQCNSKSTRILDFFGH